MDKGLIISDYRLAKNPNKQIRIMAQINGCRMDDIVKILKDAGVYEPGRGRKVANQHMRGNVDYEQMRELYNDGLSDIKIGAAMGTSPSTVRVWRLKNGLESHYVKGRRITP